MVRHARCINAHLLLRRPPRRPACSLRSPSGKHALLCLVQRAGAKQLRGTERAIEAALRNKTAPISGFGRFCNVRFVVVEQGDRRSALLLTEIRAEQSLREERQLRIFSLLHTVAVYTSNGGRSAYISP